MAGLTAKEIDQGVDALVTKQNSLIPGLGDDAWTYLLKYTAQHEGAVNFLYNNMGKENVVNPDVTAAVGLKFLNKDSCKFFLNLFFIKGTNFTQPAAIGDLEADYDKVVGMSRKQYSLDQFGEATKTEMQPLETLKTMATFMGKYVPGRLNFPELTDFATWPAQARIGLASYCYGRSPEGAPKMRKALAKRDFDTAGRESHITGWDPDKIRDNRRLFWNAARLLEQATGPNDAALETIPTRFENPIDQLPWMPGPGRTTAPHPIDANPP